MGTNDAYGGSSSSSWSDFRQAWADAGGFSVGNADSEPGEQGPGQPGEPPGVPPDALEALGAALSTALLGGTAGTTAPPTLASLLPRRYGHARSGTGTGSAVGAPGTPGRAGGRSGRQLQQLAARGGAAVGAATAYRERNGAGLLQYGITLEELDALTPRMRCARLLDLVLGDAGHPDEAAVRKAAAQQVKRILNPEESPPSAVESVRDLIGEMTMQIGLVELRDQILASQTTGQDATRKERGLRQWIAAKIRALDLGKYGTVTSTDCHRAAHVMIRDALRLLAPGRA